MKATTAISAPPRKGAAAAEKIRARRPCLKTMLRVGVLGAAGRMGRTVCEAVNGDPDLQLAAAVDPAGKGQALEGLGAEAMAIKADISCFAEAGVDVAVDFTTRDAAIEHLRWLDEHGIHAVVGTTGFSDADMEEIGNLFGGSNTSEPPNNPETLDAPETPNCIIAPNFAISAVLMMRFAELAAPHFPSAEIIEFHHDKKIDAPSGTALATMRRMEAASQSWNADPTQQVALPGVRGGSGEHGVKVHAVRAEGLVAHQEVLLGGPGQLLTIRQDSYDRVSFMPGVLLAVKAVAETPGLTVGLDSLLGV